jgi:hypothetical protein
MATKKLRDPRIGVGSLKPSPGAGKKSPGKPAPKERKPVTPKKSNPLRKIYGFK